MSAEQEMPEISREPVYFVLERGAGGEEVPTICHDILPAALRRKIPAGLSEKPPIVYQLRLDLLPDAERWLAMPLAMLLALYRGLKASGTLPPPNIEAQRRKTAPAVRKLGDWWFPPEPPWRQQ